MTKLLKYEDIFSIWPLEAYIYILVYINTIRTIPVSSYNKFLLNLPVIGECEREKEIYPWAPYSLFATFY